MKKYFLISTLIIISISFMQCESKNSGYAKMNKAETSNQKIGEPEKLNPHETEVDPNKPFYQGTILETIDSGGYTYIKIKETIKETIKAHKHEDGGDEHANFWIVVEREAAVIGDEVRFQKELVTKNYKSKTLNRTFKELMFASNIQHKVQ